MTTNAWIRIKLTYEDVHNTLIKLNDLWWWEEVIVQLQDKIKTMTYRQFFKRLWFKI